MLSDLDRRRLADIRTSRAGQGLTEAQALSWALYELWMRINYIEGPLKELGQKHDLGPATQPE